MHYSFWPNLLKQWDTQQSSGGGEGCSKVFNESIQSHGIIEIPEKLDMLMQDLKAQIERATQDREEKSEVKAKQHQAKADAEGERVHLPLKQLMQN